MSHFILYLGDGLLVTGDPWRPDVVHLPVQFLCTRVECINPTEHLIKSSHSSARYVNQPLLCFTVRMQTTEVCECFVYV